MFDESVYNGFLSYRYLVSRIWSLDEKHRIKCIELWTQPSCSTLCIKHSKPGTVWREWYPLWKRTCSKKPMKAIETHECTRTVPFTRGIQPLVGFDVSNLVSEEKRVRFNRVRLMPSFQAFSLAQPACPRNSLSYAIESRRDTSFTMHACTCR